jgi:hypothetical protein
MAKRSHRSLSKRGLPLMRRITNSSKERVWLVNGEEIKNLKDVVVKYRKVAP